MLEGVAVLTGLAAGARHLVGKSVTVYTDNIGLVWAVKKGNSRDLFAYTVAKAIHEVAMGLGVRLSIRWGGMDMLL